MNTFVVSRKIMSDEVIVRAVTSDGANVRNLTYNEQLALEGLLNESEFEQHIEQTEIKKNMLL